MTPEEVEKVARMAYLKLSREETQQYAREFEDILAHFAVIDQYDVSDAAEFAPEKEKAMALRPDEPRLFDNQETLYQNAPQLKDGMIVVPKILE